MNLTVFCVSHHLQCNEKIPVLVLNGESDIVIPPVNSVILANNIPHSYLIRWKEGGHAMIYQYPEEIGNEINNFIDAHAG